MILCTVLYNFLRVSKISPYPVDVLLGFPFVKGGCFRTLQKSFLEYQQVEYQGSMNQMINFTGSPFFFFFNNMAEPNFDKFFKLYALFYSMACFKQGKTC